MNREQKLLALLECIEVASNSSIKIFERGKGHTSRSAGIAAYEERQKLFVDLAEESPEIIARLPKVKGRDYFAFEGSVIKVVSSFRDKLAKNVFAKNIPESLDFSFDPLLRVIYKADYDFETKTAVILECYFLEIDRNTHGIIYEIDLLALRKERAAFIEPLPSSPPPSVDIPPAFIVKTKKDDVSSENDDE